MLLMYVLGYDRVADLAGFVSTLIISHAQKASASAFERATEPLLRACTGHELVIWESRKNNITDRATIVTPLKMVHASVHAISWPTQQNWYQNSRCPSRSTPHNNQECSLTENFRQKQRPKPTLYEAFMRLGLCVELSTEDLADMPDGLLPSQSYFESFEERFVDGV